MASFTGGFLKLASLDSSEESTLPAGWPGKLLILSQNSGPACRGGFQVDSPVRNPAASEIARSSPPYTFGAGEEPSQGGAQAKVAGGKLAGHRSLMVNA